MDARTELPIDEPEGDMFSGMKKKKKGKKVVIDEELNSVSPAPVAPPATVTIDAPVQQPAQDGGDVPADLDFSDLKKKKKKKVVLPTSDDDEAPKARTVDAFGNEIISEVVIDATKKPEDTTVADEGGEDEFADLKKKKRKGSKKATFDLEAFEKELAEADASAAGAATEGDAATPGGSDGEDGGEDAEGLDDVPEGEDPFGTAGGEEGTLSRAEAAAEAKAWLKEDRDYTYTELLGRFYNLLYASHPSLSSSGLKKRYTLAPPSMHREGNKRSVFANVAEICKKMHRQPEHVIMFLFAELGTSGSVDGSGRLVIKGRFQQKQIENVLRRYIVEYVTCKTCKSPDTLLTKDNRLFFMTCESCGSTRSVSAIKSGFQAQTGKRRAMRAAT